MQSVNPTTRVAEPFLPVNAGINSQLPLFPDSMIHHKVPDTILKNNRIIYFGKGDKRYGVSRSRRILTPGLLLKKFDSIRDCLQYAIGLTTAQREATLRLLRYWAYYGHVYVKEAQVTSEPGCSKATYWRTIRLLRDLGLVQVTNRFVIRPHAQISNLYRLDRLILRLARYLAEHGQRFREKWLQPLLSISGAIFWPQVLQPGNRIPFCIPGT